MKSTFIGVVFCLFIYLITGICGFFMYRDKLTNTVLDNLRQEIPIYIDSNKFIFVTLIIINISFLISSTMSIPLMFFSLKRNFLNTIIFCKKNFCKSNMRRSKISDLIYKSDDLKQSLENHPNDQEYLKTETKETLSSKEKIIITIILYISLCIVTITVKYMKEIFGVVGSTAANAINYIFPNIFLLKLTHTAFFTNKNLKSQILFLLGIFVLLLCLISEVVKLVIYDDS
jgi:amino acid permease